VTKKFLSTKYCTHLLQKWCILLEDLSISFRRTVSYYHQNFVAIWASPAVIWLSTSKHLLHSSDDDNNNNSDNHFTGHNTGQPIPTSVGAKGDCGHFQSSTPIHCVWLARYDFLLVFNSDMRFRWNRCWVKPFHRIIIPTTTRLPTVIWEQAVSNSPLVTMAAPHSPQKLPPPVERSPNPTIYLPYSWTQRLKRRKKKNKNQWWWNS